MALCGSFIFWLVMTPIVTALSHDFADVVAFEMLVWVLSTQLGAAIAGVSAALPLRIAGYRLVTNKSHALSSADEAS
jgi:hypothetical protein